MSDSDNVPDELQDRDQWLLWDASRTNPQRSHSHRSSVVRPS